MGLTQLLCVACLFVPNLGEFVDTDDIKIPRIRDVLLSSGAPAHTGQFPFMASISHDNLFLGGGALITDIWVLTAAHVVYPYSTESPSRVQVAVGGLSAMSHEPGRQLLPAALIKIHPEYEDNAWQVINNLALIKLITTVITGPVVNVIHLPAANEIIQLGDKVLFCGWGGLGDHQPQYPLQYTTALEVEDIKKCDNAIPYDIGAAHLCTTPYPDSTAFIMDSGSPMFRFDPEFGTILLGIINYAPSYSTVLPTVYANVPNHHWWIASITGV